MYSFLFNLLVFFFLTAKRRRKKINCNRLQDTEIFLTPLYQRELDIQPTTLATLAMRSWYFHCVENNLAGNWWKSSVHDGTNRWQCIFITNLL
jgi:hypothetical protein